MDIQEFESLRLLLGWHVQSLQQRAAWHFTSELFDQILKDATPVLDVGALIGNQIRMLLEDSMRSNLIFGAIAHISNRYLLVKAAAKATRKLHRPYTRVPDTMNDVFLRFALGNHIAEGCPREAFDDDHVVSTENGGRRRGPSPIPIIARRVSSGSGQPRLAVAKFSQRPTMNGPRYEHVRSQRVATNL